MGVSQSNSTRPFVHPEDRYVYTATFEDKPFEEGGCRFAFRGTLVLEPNQNRFRDRLPQFDGERVVIKMVKSEFGEHEDVWRADIRASEKASEYAILFNRAIPSNKPISFPIPLVVQINTRAGYWFLGFIGGYKKVGNKVVGASEFVVIEKFIEGKYQKFNGNNGYLSIEPGAVESTLMPCFSHWSWEESKGDILICDLQGVRSDNQYELTDPAIHSSVGRIWGGTDLGRTGQAIFFYHHRCSKMCTDNRLPARTLTSESAAQVDALVKKGIIPKRASTYMFQIPKEHRIGVTTQFLA
jgi:hypothetical protein